MIFLLRANLRMLMRSPWQLGLAVLGVSLGIAVVVAIDMTVESAQRAFAHSSQVVLGRATHFVARPEGYLSDSEYAAFRLALADTEMAPILEGSLQLGSEAATDGQPSRNLTVLGVDPFSEAPFRDFLPATRRLLPTRAVDQPMTSADAAPGRVVDGGWGQSQAVLRGLMTEPGGAVATAQTAMSLGWVIGGRYEVLGNGRRQSLTLVGVLDSLQAGAAQGLRDVLIVDMSVAQKVLGRPGQLSRVDLIESGATSQTTAKALANDWRRAVLARLPPDVVLHDAGSRTRTARELTRAFELNLFMLSLLALVVGLFLVFNALSYAVIRRRMQIGVLRAIGVTSREIVVTLLIEAMFVGAAAGLVGIAAGWLLAQQLLALVTQVINDHYFSVAVGEANLRMTSIGKAVLLAVPGAALAALPPALEASRVTPRAALTRSTLESEVVRLAFLALPIGMGLLLLSMLCLLQASLLAGYASLLLMVLAFAVLAPAAVHAGCGLLQGIALRIGFGDHTQTWLIALVLGGIRRGLSRTGVAVAALAVALSATVGVQLMVSSFRHSLEDWLGATLSGDVYVVAPGTNARLPKALPELVGNMPQVQAWASSLDVQVQTQYGAAHLKVVGGDFAYRGLQVLQGDERDAYAALVDGAGILVSEPYAQKHDLSVGGALVLSTPVGHRRLSIIAVIRDYTSEQGLLMLAQKSYEALYLGGAASHIDSLAIKLVPAAQTDDFESMLRLELTRWPSDAQPFDAQPFKVIRNGEIRRRSLEIFDRTFAITNVLSALATLTAVIGLISALLALALERAPELATLRVLGMTRVQVGGVVMAQSGLLGLFAGLLAIPLGLALAAILVYVINLRAFGWGMRLQVSPEVLASVVVLAVAASLFASIYPAWRMGRTQPALALRAD